MKSARAAAITGAALLLGGCPMTEEQVLSGSLRRGLPPPFANCIAERTFDALSPEERAAYRTRRTARISALHPGTLATPRSLVAAQESIAIDLPPDAAERVRRATARCRIHNWRLG